MTTYLLDTTVWVDLLRTNSQSIRRRLISHSKDTVGLSVITACELQYGIEVRAARHPHLRVREQELLSSMLAPFTVFPLNAGMAGAYGKLRATLERSGASIGALDMFIAAQAVTVEAILVSSNRKEFQRVSGLRVEDWR